MALRTIIGVAAVLYLAFVATRNAGAQSPEEREQIRQSLAATNQVHECYVSYPETWRREVSDYGIVVFPGLPDDFAEHDFRFAFGARAMLTGVERLFIEGDDLAWDDVKNKGWNKEQYDRVQAYRQANPGWSIDAAHSLDEVYEGRSPTALKSLGSVNFRVRITYEDGTSIEQQHFRIIRQGDSLEASGIVVPVPSPYSVYDEQPIAFNLGCSTKISMSVPTFAMMCAALMERVTLHDRFPEMSCVKGTSERLVFEPHPPPEPATPSDAEALNKLFPE